MLFLFGVVCSPELVPVTDTGCMPRVAVVLLPGVIEHWVVKSDCSIYDPAGYVYMVGELPFDEATSAERVIKCAEVISRRY